MSAVISRCGQYRYELERVLDPTEFDRVGQRPANSRTVTFVGVNPSTADAELDDATIRKCRGFAARWGYTRLLMVNLFAFRSTDVRRLADAADPIGPAANFYLRGAIVVSDLVVPCWGSITKLPDRLCPRISQVREMLVEYDRPLRVLGFTRYGDPRHPLMLSYDTPLVPWVWDRR